MNAANSNDSSEKVNIGCDEKQPKTFKFSKCFEGVGCGVQQRYILALMVFFGLLNAFATRANLSIAIIDMVIPVDISSELVAAELNSDEIVCPRKKFNETLVNDLGSKSTFLDYYNQMLNAEYEIETGRYDWSQELQGIILSSFFLGYLLSHIPGGLLVQKVGGKSLLGFGVFICGILNLLTPISVQYGEL